MINFDHLRKQLCINGLLDQEWNLHQHLIFLYIEVNLSGLMISQLSGKYISIATVFRLLRKFKIPVKNPGGPNNLKGINAKRSN